MQVAASDPNRLMGRGRGMAEALKKEEKVLISLKVFIKSFCKSQFPHKSVNLSFIITDLKDKLTSLCGN